MPNDTFPPIPEDEYILQLSDNEKENTLRRRIGVMYVRLIKNSLKGKKSKLIQFYTSGTGKEFIYKIYIHYYDLIEKVGYSDGISVPSNSTVTRVGISTLNNASVNGFTNHSYKDYDYSFEDPSTTYGSDVLKLLMNNSLSGAKIINPKSTTQITDSNLWVYINGALENPGSGLIYCPGIIVEFKIPLRRNP